MKHLITALLILFSVPATAAEEPHLAQNPETELQTDKIYFFAHSLCQSCKDAYIYLETRHKDLNIPITDMKEHHNLELYKQCVWATLTLWAGHPKAPKPLNTPYNNIKPTNPVSKLPPAHRESLRGLPHSPFS